MGLLSQRFTASSRVNRRGQILRAEVNSRLTTELTTDEWQPVICPTATTVDRIMHLAGVRKKNLADSELLTSSGEIFHIAPLIYSETGSTLLRF